MRTRIAYDKLDGYNNILPGEIHKYSNNELSYIFCDGTIAYSTYQDYENDIKLWVSKLRKGGTINIVGIDLNSLCINYINSNNVEQINQVIESSKCILNYQSIEEILKKNGLKIVSISLKGVYYNIEASR